MGALRHKMLVGVLLAGAALALPGCTTASVGQSSSDTTPIVSASASTTSAPSEALVPLGPDGRGSLSHVTFDLRTAGYIVPASPESRAVRRYWRIVDVGVYDHAYGVRTRLIVPMWFDSKTAFVPPEGSTFPTTLAEAEAHPDWSWDEAGTTDVKYHMEDGVLYVDEVSSPAGYSSDLSR